MTNFKGVQEKQITDFRKSDAMSRRAQELIPGGAHTYSKGPDQSPKLGPKFIERGKGSHVWDVDGNEYIDWAMGLGSISLGHAYEPVLEAVRKELLRGSNFQCPSPVEVEFAEQFLSLVPGADMVKFAKNGSTVTTAAVKLARAYTGRKYVAYCSDHGFFSYDDWYIGKKSNNSGVPEETAALSMTFRYNDISSLQELFSRYPKQIACVILEPMEFDFPQDGFLRKVQDLCRKEGAVYILDEMITGFRVAVPGAHKMFDVEPDLTTWGKGLANGFSTCVLAGKREIMELGGLTHNKEKVFLISTTHGAETHALAAAMATLREIVRQDSVGHGTKVGEQLRKELARLIVENGLQGYIDIKGHPAWQVLIFRDNEKKVSDGFRTLVFQETVRRGLLYRGALLPTLSHSEQDVARTLEVFSEVFKVYRQALDKGSYTHFLVGEPVKPVFRKFN
ncbi:MAG: glutamate-1-semialdehyde 2,1-aminomutase [Elusimicrobiota bacterium]|jgi:glutamate-1-semialdehyde aminotransferase